MHEQNAVAQRWPRASRLEWLLDAVFFLAMAWTTRSQALDARDLVWGLWLASLTAGVVFWFGAMLFSRASPLRDKEIKSRWVALGVVLLVFVLFCLVHGLVHQTLFMFLMAFLPYGATLEEWAADDAGAARLFKDLYAAYWPIVTLTIAAWGLTPVLRPREKPEAGALILPVPMGNLVRLVVAIFVLAGLHVARLTRLAYYPVLLVLYLPVETLMRHHAGKWEQPAP